MNKCRKDRNKKTKKCVDISIMFLHFFGLFQKPVVLGSRGLGAHNASLPGTPF
jgi:hypothetical protein